jgi:phage protein D
MATLVVADPNFKWVDSPFLEPGKKVEIRMGYGQALKTVFVGLISRPEASFPEDGTPSLSIRAYDLSQKLRRKDDTKPRT